MWSPDATLLRTLTIPLLNATDTNRQLFAREFTILMTLFQRRYEYHEPSACVIGNVSILKLVFNFLNCKNLRFQNEN